MDSVTHIFLGGAIGQALGARRLGGAGFWLGALASTLPDMDVFLHTGNVMRDHALHRHFMHALVMVPVLAGVAMVPFLLNKKMRGARGAMAAVALVACLSHTLLDALTSYGTMMFWPFSERRISLDIVAVVDLIYTGILVVGVVWTAWRIRAARRGARLPQLAWPAWMALLLSCLYLSFAAAQHWRALDAQRQLLAARGVVDAEHCRVLPQIGGVVSYRSLYISGGKMHADGIRVPWLGPPLVKEGLAVDLVTPADLLTRQFAWEFAAFETFADGYVGRDAEHSLWLDDMRYTRTVGGADAAWALQIEQTDTPLWHLRTDARQVGELWKELVAPAGYSPIVAVHRQR